MTGAQLGRLHNTIGCDRERFAALLCATKEETLDWVLKRHREAPLHPYALRVATALDRLLVGLDDASRRAFLVEFRAELTYSGSVAARRCLDRWRGINS